MNISEYAHGLVQEVLTKSDSDSISTHDAFAESGLTDIEVAGRLGEWDVSYYKSHGVEISAYGFNALENKLDLIFVDFTRTVPTPKVGFRELSTYARRLINFAIKSRDIAMDFEKQSETYEMAMVVDSAVRNGADIRLLIVTNSASSATKKPIAPTLDGCRVAVDLWDLPRLYKLASSGVLQEPIAVSFVDPLPCLSTPTTDQNYSVFLAIIRGDVLANIYSEHGSRLLELNVRAFLQTRGSVNRGIRETLIKSPERFLAYNNGISATASKISMASLPSGGLGIKKVHDLQIVNGGQTTASLYSCLTKDEADLSQVLVQMKLTVVEPSKLSSVVPEISKFSNTQNKVTVVDFSSNDPFHVELEKVSRSLWAPALGESSQETKWFYERARGQYLDALARERTPAKQRAFRAIYPTRQKFTKTDVAKWENCWEVKPWLVSRGAEKNFRFFMSELENYTATEDPQYVKDVISRGILFRACEGVVTEQNFGGYRANIVAYTVAKFASSIDHRLDLNRVWLDQSPTDRTLAAFADISHAAFAVISSPKGTAHVGEWTKKEACWAHLAELEWRVPKALEAELAPATKSSGNVRVRS